MEDIIKMKDLFDSFGINYRLDEVLINYCPKELKEKNPFTAIITDEGIGYAGFEAVYYFDNCGKFVGYGVWE